MGYMDVVEKFHREQHPDPRVQKWQEEQRIEDRARELLAEYLREQKYLDVRPTTVWRPARACVSWARTTACLCASSGTIATRISCSAGRAPVTRTASRPPPSLALCRAQAVRALRCPHG
jgi:hypothetical protein